VNVAHAYTPGLRVTTSTIVRRTRRLPLKGHVLVAVGDAVGPHDVVARTELPGNVQTVNVASRLGVDPAGILQTLRKPVGADVRCGELLAETRGFLGLAHRSVAAPADGFIESASSLTGQLVLREPPIPVEVSAYLRGVVVELLPDEGVIVEARGALLQGIFGVGGETWGTVAVAVDSPDAVLTPGRLRTEHRGHVVVGGALVTYDALMRARALGVAAVVAGGLDDLDLRRLLGRDLGVAITGSEDIGLTLVLTEGFGHIRMSDRAWELLAARAGRLASVSGATQIRAGVLRPEVLIPESDVSHAPAERDVATGLAVGTLVRVIRAPHFGRVGQVVELPPELRRLETEAMVRVLVVVFPGDGARVLVPRANVEIIAL
jgi:hypothetical protein